MTISQLEYITALAEHRHFGKAAQSLQVAQSTLSMMIKKGEEELGVVIFDRKSKPLKPTQIGVQIIRQAKRVLAEYEQLHHVIHEFSNELTGHYRLGVIPTASPYIMPQLVSILARDYPSLKLSIVEEQTNHLIDEILQGQLDAAILATPLQHSQITEYPLFYEEFFAFGDFDTHGKDYLLPDDINPHNLWLLEEGHCLRSQVINLCELKENTEEQIKFKSGSLETMIEIVRQYNGLTILPELTAKKLSGKDKKRLGRFNSPAPFREMSLVTHQYSAKYKFVEAIQDVIEEVIPIGMRKLKKDSRLISID